MPLLAAAGVAVLLAILGGTALGVWLWPRLSARTNADAGPPAFGTPGARQPIGAPTEAASPRVIEVDEESALEPDPPAEPPVDAVAPAETTPDVEAQATRAPPTDEPASWAGLSEREKRAKRLRKARRAQRRAERAAREAAGAT